MMTTEGLRKLIQDEFSWKPSTRTVLNWSLHGVNGRKLKSSKIGPAKIYAKRDVAVWIRFIRPLIPMLKQRASRPPKPAKARAKSAGGKR